MVFDQKSPVQPVSEFREGTLSMTYVGTLTPDRFKVHGGVPIEL